MTGFSNDPRWEKACTPAGSHNTGSFSIRETWDFSCYPGDLPSSCTRLPGDITLSTLVPPTGFKIIGAASNDQAGSAVAGIGDINNDGYDDVAIGAPEANGGAGKVYVVFGNSNPSGVNLGSLTQPQGFTITCIDGGSRCGHAISGVGDVNSDGFDDYIVGAPNANAENGKAYLIFGKAQPQDITLPPADSSIGITIHGEAAIFARAGYSVSGIGDFNNDGKPDFAVGAPYSQRVFVFFGKSQDTPWSDIYLPTADLTITNADQLGGLSVYGGKDVNGGGIPDLVIGAPGGVFGAGKVWVIWGSDSLPSSINLGSIGSYGIAIEGVGGTVGQVGYSVTLADLDGDGKAEIIIGAPDENGNAGAVYIIWGSDSLPSPINLGSIGSYGFKIEGVLGNTGKLGFSVSNAGDQDGDGKEDLLIGEPDADSAYLIYGAERASFPLGAMILPNEISSYGIKFTGNSLTSTGSSVANAGDFTGDGCPDLLIGARLEDTEEKADAGVTYVVL